MAKIRINFTLPIPQVIIDTIDRVTYQFRKWAFQINPYRCSCCEKKMYVGHVQYKYVFPNGRHLMVENLTHNTVCRECIVKELTTGTWDPRFTQLFKGRGVESQRNKEWLARKCDVTDARTRSYNGVEIAPHIDMIFAKDSIWNNANVSKQAVIECVKYGKITTSYWGVWRKKKMAPKNRKGLFIDENGELL